MTTCTACHQPVGAQAPDPDRPGRIGRPYRDTLDGILCRTCDPLHARDTQEDEPPTCPACGDATDHTEDCPCCTCKLADDCGMQMECGNLPLCHPDYAPEEDPQDRGRDQVALELKLEAANA